MAEDRIAAGAEAFGKIHAQLDFFTGEAGSERAHIRIQGQQLGSFHAVKSDPLQHVRTRSAEADDFDCGGGNRLLGISGVRDH